METMTTTNKTQTRRTKAKILAEHHVADVRSVHGVTFDGRNVVFVHGDKGELVKMNDHGMETARLNVTGADAGVAFDGTNLWVVAGASIHCVDPESGRILRTIPVPDEHTSGLAWQGGALWAGSFRGKKLFKLDAATGKVLRIIESDRFVTGISFSSSELWHGTYEGEGDDARTELRRIDESNGQVLEVVEMPDGMVVSGLELTGDRAYCGDYRTGKIRVVERPGKD